jgi:hypothetical protein
MERRPAFIPRADQTEPSRHAAAKRPDLAEVWRASFGE